MTRMSRRAFLRSSVALGAGAVLMTFSDGSFRIALAAAGPEVRKLRLIHTNDHHSRIEPVTGITIGRVNNANVVRNLGGVARRKTLFDQIKADTTGAQDKIFLDAGDVFQGTLYFNQYNGAADLFFYNRLGYAAQAIGNHEFDKGDQVLADYIKDCAIPVVAANISVVAPSPLVALYQEEVPAPAAPGAVVGKWGKRTIVTMPSGEKVGIFGLTTVETKNIASPSAQVTFDPNYAVVANAQAAALRAAGCKTVIALTHIGYDADIALAPQLKGVNLIVGGHSHTPLLLDGTFPYGTSRVAKYPQALTDADGNSIIVVQDWEWAKWVGDITIGFDAEGRVTGVSGETIRPVWADFPTNRTDKTLITGEGAEIAADATFQTQIDTVYKPAITTLQNRIIGATTVELPNANVRSAETALGNLLADAIRDRVLKFADNDPTIPVVCILNGGGIRVTVPVGAITVAKVLEVMPFGNQVSRVDVTGAQLKAALENGVSALTPDPAVDTSRNPVGSGRFSNVSGLKYKIDRSGDAAQSPQPATATLPALAARPGSRITNIQVLEGTEYKLLDLNKKYRVATLNFVMNGGDGYTMFAPTGDLADSAAGRGTNQINSGLIDADVVQEYIAAQTNATVSPQIEGRIEYVYKVYMPFALRPAATVAVAADLD